MRIAAYITVYCDLDSSLKCIESIQKQSIPVDEIYIVDNSPQPLSLPDNIIVNSHPTNIGISGGLREAIQWSIEESFDFLWTFDQDSYPAIDCLENLINGHNHLVSDLGYKNIAILAPVALDTRFRQIISDAIYDRYRFTNNSPDSIFKSLCSHNIYRCGTPITSGSLLNLEAAKKIDLPNSDLFIDGVDIDYGTQFQQAGFQNFIVTTATLYHSFGAPKLVSVLGREKILQDYSPLRHYYICRNHTYLDLYYAQGLWKIYSFVFRLKYMLITIVGIIFSNSLDKYEKIQACSLGTYHGLIGKLGKLWY